MTASMLPRGRILLAAALLAAAAVVPYIPFLPLPPISDDYMQIGLAREFVSMEGLPQLAAHPLYRTRATSLVFTRLVEAASGEEIATSIFVHRLAGVLLHLANGLLIFAAGVWPRLGYRRSFAAALAFLLLADHQEAVVWVAAVHELLVFAFSILCLIAWAQWLRVRGTGWLLLTALAFVLALYSKESAAVLPALMALIWTLEADRRYANLLPIALALLGALAYTYFVFGASREHQHLNDGTFSLAAPFLQTLLRTTWRLFWPWGVVAAALLYRQRHARPLLAALACSALALLPYSFLTYMPYAPSRHTYLATLGLAATLAFAWQGMRDTSSSLERRFATALALAFLLWNPFCLWFKKYPQYVWRSRPTEAFLGFARQHGSPVYVGPSPHSVWVYRYTANVALGWPHSDVKSVAESEPPGGTAVFTHSLEP